MMEGNHGSEMHRALIYHAKLHLEAQGYTILDPVYNREWLKFRRPSCPDILGKRTDKFTTTRGKRRVVTDYVIVEVETKATKARVRAKEKLYDDQIVMGWVLIVLDARKIKGIRKGWDAIRIRDIKDWLEESI